MYLSSNVLFVRPDSWQGTFALQVIGVAVLYFASTTLAEPKLHSSYNNAPTAETLDNVNEVSDEESGSC
jgi:hypothetical protein